MLVTGVVTHFASKELRRSAELNLQEVAIQLRDKMENDLYERYADLNAAAKMVAWVAEDDQFTDVTQLLNELQRNFVHYAWIGMATTQGTVIASTGGMLKGVDVSGRPWFTAALEGPFLGDAHPALLLESKLGNSSHRPLRFIDVAVPVMSRDNSRVLGVLGAHLYLDWVGHVGDSLLEPLRERLEAELVVVDQFGKVLYGPDALIEQQIPDDLKAATGEHTAGFLLNSMTSAPDSAATEDFVIGYSRLRDRDEYKGFNWLVMVRKPVARAFAPARELRNNFLLMSVVLSALFAAFAWLAARRVARPLLGMAEEARQLDSSSDDVQITQWHDYEEVQVLSATFRDLIKGLKDKTRELNELNASLEQRVEDRTEALADSNQKLRTEMALRDRLRLEREALIRRLEETIRTDVLTGISNRRHFFEQANLATKRAERAQTELSVIMFDADYFKSINDTFGHATGDQALIHLTRIAGNIVRDIDVFARVGGEEFAVVLERTDEAGAAEVAERLRAAIADAPLEVTPDTRHPLTISAGVAATGAGDYSLDHLMARADKALYSAKSSGRNRVVSWSAIRN